MATQAIDHMGLRFRIAWALLVTLSIATAINSLVRLFLEPTPEFVAGWVATAMLSAVLLLIPFRKRERWAWFSAWIFVALLASVFVLGSHVGLYYLGAGVIGALCLLLTFPAFFQD